MRRQDSIGSQNSSSGSYPVNESTRRSNHSAVSSKVLGSGTCPQNQREDSEQASPTATFLCQNAAPSKDLLDAAEAAIQLLKAEAGMWEQNSRRLMMNVERLQKELSDEKIHRASLEDELSELCEECDGMKQEVEQLKMLLEETREKQTVNEDLISNSMDQTWKDLEDEMKFQKEANANLSLQLKKSLEANAELVIILQELESTIEKQKIEMDNLCAERQKFQESLKNLADTRSILEKKLAQKNYEIEVERGLSNKRLIELEAEWRAKVAEREDEITNLEAKLSDALGNLERDRLQLTNENLKLQLQLNDPCSSETEINKLKSRVCVLEAELANKEIILKEISSFHLDLENKNADLEHEVQVFKDKAFSLANELHEVRTRAEDQETDCRAAT
ncbi:hypothetical protein L484_007990 [Morus notabilis]|uniref:Uncharacterized protein n=1 Tax=Morus notabilis TaxID=981085 RepID=W9QVP9_9ROSA|nr:hypothetical protein L484_007990 [Morus notabilis]